MNEYQARGAALGIADGLNRGLNAFRNIREARLEQQRKEDLYDLQLRKAKLHIDILENDPRKDPAFVELQRKKLTLGQKKADLEMEETQKMIDYASADIDKQNKMLASKARRYNDLADEYPDMFGDLRILPDLETGTIKVDTKATTERRLTPYQERGVGMAKQEAINALKTGKFYDKGQIGGFGRIKTPEDFIAFAGDKGVDLKDPEIISAMRESEHDFGSFLGTAEKYSEDQERLIQANMEAYGRSRDEIVAALQQKGKL